MSPRKMRLHGPSPCLHAGPASQQHHQKTQHFKYIRDTLLPKWPVTTQAAQSPSELTAECAEPLCLAGHQGLPQAVWGLSTPGSCRSQGAVARSLRTVAVTQHRTRPASLLLTDSPSLQFQSGGWECGSRRSQKRPAPGVPASADRVPLRDRTSWCKYRGAPHVSWGQVHAVGCGRVGGLRLDSDSL